MPQLLSTTTLFPYTTLFRSTADTEFELPGLERIRHAFEHAPAHRLDIFHERFAFRCLPDHRPNSLRVRSEEHTSELQSRGHLVCRLPLEKKNDYRKTQR